MGFRFLDEDAPGDWALAPGSSVAFRFLFDFWAGEPEPEATGLAARLPPAGLVARLDGPPFCPPLKGLLPWLAPFVFTLCGLGLVARLATTEWPPRLGAEGDVAREPAADATLDCAGTLDGDWEPEREGACEGCCCIAGSFVGAGCSSSSSSYSEHQHSMYIRTIRLTELAYGLRSSSLSYAVFFSRSRINFFMALPSFVSSSSSSSSDSST
jgi:hypothetical protein